MAVAGGAALALTAPLTTTAQAAPASNITRTSDCAVFTGQYTYWSVGSWFGYKLTGRVLRLCSGSGWHTVVVTGKANWGNGDYESGAITHMAYGESQSVGEIGQSSGVKDIRIALTDTLGG
ncbi:hypothetical protein [Streptomyces sp. NPDC127033]|uniref:hypothetical protein n=1 Tax=Streptomyces sp. NPDC127033 TaxID=3347110 RepID=UPI00364D5743